MNVAIQKLMAQLHDSHRIPWYCQPLLTRPTHSAVQFRNIIKFM